MHCAISISHGGHDIGGRADVTGIVNVLLGNGGGISTNTFNITTGTTGTGDAYSDGSAGTSTGVAAGTISNATLTGGKIICEVSTFYSPATPGDRFRVRGFSANPGQSWLNSITVNSQTHSGASATYTWDAVHGMASWIWSPTWNLVNSTYNGNTIIHGM